mgnify:CR=1 FL=1
MDYNLGGGAVKAGQHKSCDQKLIIIYKWLNIKYVHLFKFTSIVIKKIVI